MKLTKRNESGFEHVTVFVIVALLIAVTFVGFRVANKPTAKTVTQTATTTNAQTTLKTKADVTNAKNTLDASSLDADLNPGQLDKDLSDLR